MIATRDQRNDVDPSEACPCCGQRDADLLLWLDDDRVECQACGTIYEPGKGERHEQA